MNYDQFFERKMLLTNESSHTTTNRGRQRVWLLLGAFSFSMLTACSSLSDATPDQVSAFSACNDSSKVKTARIAKTPEILTAEGKYVQIESVPGYDQSHDPEGEIVTYYRPGQLVPYVNQLSPTKGRSGPSRIVICGNSAGETSFISIYHIARNGDQ